MADAVAALAGVQPLAIVVKSEQIAKLAASMDEGELKGALAPGGALAHMIAGVVHNRGTQSFTATGSKGSVTYTVEYRANETGEGERVYGQLAFMCSEPRKVSPLARGLCDASPIAVVCENDGEMAMRWVCGVSMRFDKI